MESPSAIKREQAKGLVLEILAVAAVDYQRVRCGERLGYVERGLVLEILTVAAKDYQRVWTVWCAESPRLD